MSNTSTEEKAIFAAGCFWGIEKAFLDVPGVTNVISGYTGGHTDHPTYEQVCSDTTGHAEAVQVTFDPAKVSYEVLAQKFFSFHDPTQMNRQGPDVGTQYRSGIFYLDESQKEIAERIKNELTPNFFPKTIATEITAATTFWLAEEYHQRYFEKHPNAVCHI
ncbi:MAG: peptide-methionine (S)-S-oxide reductase MsrA [Minisyncoccia bacterium]